MNIKNRKLITILGATASGKTTLASNLAYRINGEIISADSRQVYRGMTIGTGKDLDDYIVNGQKIKYHLIDIVNPGYKYNVYEFQRDFLISYNEVLSNNRQAILCGGSGMYIESVLKSYKLINVPVNDEFRQKLDKMSDSELTSMLEEMKKLHNISDTSSRKRLIRAVEIAYFYNNNKSIDTSFPDIRHFIFGVKFDRDSRRRRITTRLKERLNSGMIEEVENLLKSGVSADDLLFYGLEYKYVTNYVTGLISYDEMFEGLNTAIHQFAKRQMTWFRKMERDGIKIKWIDGYTKTDEKINIITESMNK